jgi:zona occludens toxin (predicted ATPase)
LVETSRSPQWVFLDHTPRPFVTLKKVTAESSDPVIRFAQGEVVAAASLGAAFAVDAAVPAQRVKVAMSATPNLRIMLVSPIYTFSAFTDCQD